jgi:hypothetical protein
MPNLIGDTGYNGLGGLAQNYRRVATGGSNYGTRRIQFYQIVVYGLSDAEVAKLNDYRVVNNTEVDIDQEPEREFRQATVAELVVRAIQSVSEVYIVGAHDVDQEEPDYNDFYLIIGVSGDTYASGNEMENRDAPPDGPSNNNAYLNEALDDVFDNMDAPANDGYDVYPTFIYGDHFSTITYPNTMSRAERKAASAPARLARKNG